MGSNTENELHISYHDSAAAAMLNPLNVLDYFCDRANPFYDRQSNNELIKMQRLSLEHMQTLQGIEYILLHAQDPILYVVRKQERLSKEKVTPLVDYYIISGVIYRAPDLNSILNSRISSAIYHIQSAFDEMMTYKAFHPSRGYSWNFPGDKASKGDSSAGNDESESSSSDAAEKERDRERLAAEPGSFFQRKRVDALLVELSKKYPFKPPTTTTAIVSAGSEIAPQVISGNQASNETIPHSNSTAQGVKREAPSDSSEPLRKKMR